MSPLLTPSFPNIRSSDLTQPVGLGKDGALRCGTLRDVEKGYAGKGLLLLRQRDANPLHDRRVGVDMGDRGVADGADGDLGACENQRYARRFLVHRRLAPQAARAEIVVVNTGKEYAYFLHPPALHTRFKYISDIST